ncbi:unnamed protein product [Haemonchus placei]|uniref:HGDE_central domain-containing protein n=1 Tax=Haemonchus placei TaxID=6290 RepID=A0A0N4VY25_HAEPC|nr:unnamed protein product [Haemonchus placei]
MFRKIHVVKEKRPYAKWGSETTYNTGIVEARRILNDLHLTLARANYTQVFVDQMSPDVVGITRHNPITHDTVFIVAHTAFNKHHINKDRVYLKNIPIGENPDVLTGLTNYKVSIRQYVPPDKAKMCVVHGNVNGFIELTNFPSGSVIGFRVRLTENARTSIGTIRAVIAGNAELEKGSPFSRNVYSTLPHHPLLEDSFLIFQNWHLYSTR